MESPILVVDDEAVVRQYAAVLLRRAGFSTIEAEDGVAAEQELQQRKGEVALVLTDVRMPRMDGVELARAAASQFPKVPFVLMSGYAFDPISCSRIGYRLSKPFTAGALISIVYRALGRPNEPGPTDD